MVRAQLASEASWSVRIDRLPGGSCAGGIPSPGLASLRWFRFHFQFGLLFSKPRRLGKSAARSAVVRRHHWVITGQTPFGAIFIRRHPELRQIPLEALESFSVIQANEVQWLLITATVPGDPKGVTRTAVPRPHQVLKQAHWTFHFVDLTLLPGSATMSDRAIVSEE
jgi:hypothetical protein